MYDKFIEKYGEKNVKFFYYKNNYFFFKIIKDKNMKSENSINNMTEISVGISVTNISTDVIISTEILSINKLVSIVLPTFAVVNGINLYFNH